MLSNDYLRWRVDIKMPPKNRFTKEMIINTGYMIVKDEGVNALVARNVASKLGSTVSPIFSYFTNMKELKKEVYLKVKEFCIDYLKECLDYDIIFKEFGLRWIKFAREYPNFYKLLFEESEIYSSVNNFQKEFADIIVPIKESVKAQFSLNDDDAESLINMMTINANGIISFVIGNYESFSEEKISALISDSCLGLVMLMNTREGKMEKEVFERYAKSESIEPKRIKGDKNAKD